MAIRSSALAWAAVQRAADGGAAINQRLETCTQRVIAQVPFGRRGDYDAGWSLFRLA